MHNLSKSHGFLINLAKYFTKQFFFIYSRNAREEGMGGIEGEVDGNGETIH